MKLFAVKPYMCQRANVLSVKDLLEVSLEGISPYGYAHSVGPPRKHPRHPLGIIIGENLTYWRMKRGWARKDLALRLQIEHTTFNAYERGRRGVPEGPTLIAWVKALNPSDLPLDEPRCSIDDLLAGVDETYDAIARIRIGQRIGRTGQDSADEKKCADGTSSVMPAVVKGGASAAGDEHVHPSPTAVLQPLPPPKELAALVERLAYAIITREIELCRPRRSRNDAPDPEVDRPRPRRGGGTGTG